MSRNSPNRTHPLWVEGYYGPGGRKGGKGRVGEREGDLAIATVHSSESSRDMEIAALESREDIGAVNHGRNGGIGL